jgi:hypothetical protein
MLRKLTTKLKASLMTWTTNLKTLLSTPMFWLLFLWALHFTLAYQQYTIFLTISGPIVGIYTFLYYLRWYRTFSPRKGLGNIVKPLPLDTTFWPKSKITRERYRHYATYRREHPNETIENIAEEFDVEPITIQRALEAERAGALIEVDRASVTGITDALYQYHKAKIMKFLETKLKRPERG